MLIKQRKMVILNSDEMEFKAKAFIIKATDMSYWKKGTICTVANDHFFVALKA